MNFWDFYAAHPALGTVALVVLVIVVDSIGVDAVRALAVLRWGGIGTLNVHHEKISDRARRKKTEGGVS